jgi:hypothetical protein
MTIEGDEVEADLSFVVLCADHLSAFGPYPDEAAAQKDARDMGGAASGCTFAVLPLLTREADVEDWAPAAAYL